MIDQKLADALIEQIWNMEETIKALNKDLDRIETAIVSAIADD